MNEKDVIASALLGHDIDIACITTRLAINSLNRFINDHGKYSDDEVVKVLKFFIRPDQSDLIKLFHHNNVAETDLELFYGAICRVFCQIFEFRCRPNVSSGLAVSLGSMNSLCYLWWELIPYGLDLDLDAVAQSQIKDMTLVSIISILELKNIACLESACNGLVFLSHFYPDDIYALCNILLPDFSGYKKEQIESLMQYLDG